eukprot:3385085-Prymnesium_polylepis.1
MLELQPERDLLGRDDAAERTALGHAEARAPLLECAAEERLDDRLERVGQRALAHRRCAERAPHVPRVEPGAEAVVAKRMSTRAERARIAQYLQAGGAEQMLRNVAVRRCGEWSLLGCQSRAGPLLGVGGEWSLLGCPSWAGPLLGVGGRC